MKFIQVLGVNIKNIIKILKSNRLNRSFWKKQKVCCLFMIFTELLSGIAEAAFKAASAIFCSVYGIMRRLRAYDSP